MISSAACLQNTQAAARTSKSAQFYVCSRCAASLRRLPLAGSSYIQRSRSTAFNQRREFHATSTIFFPSPTTLLDSKSRALFESELERKENIFDYLRKWKPSTPEDNIDPILVPTGQSGSKRAGNMLQDEMVPAADRAKGWDVVGYQDHISDEEGHFPYLWPGDLVLLEHDTGFNSGQLAVYVRTINDQQQFYTDRGKWRVAHPNEMSFSLKARAPPEMISPLLPYFPTDTVEKSYLPQIGLEGGVPRPIGRPLIQWMSSFAKEAQVFYSHHTGVLDNIYDFLADEKEFKLLTLEEIGEKVLGRDPDTFTEAERHAIHNALKRESFYIIANQNYSTTESYTIRPKNQAEVVRTVVNWVRQYQNIQAREALGWQKDSARSSPITQFVNKARRLVYRSRKSRQPTTAFSVSPTMQKTATKEQAGDQVYKETPVETFSASDLKIIEFLRLWITPPSLMSSAVLKSTGSMIIRSVEMYDDYPMTAQTGYMFLQEIGVVAPWENMHVLSELVGLPGHGVSNVSDQIMKECNEFSENLAPGSLVDSMKGLRKDWGDLPVFCVDSPEAAEIDDGFSIEPVKGSTGEYWIHVHVANPSAFIPPDHILAKGAEHFKRSFYAPERIYPMLPPRVTHEYFSLGPGKPALTFSAKINKKGEILDKKVVNGSVNNVVYITPDRLRRLYGIDYSNIPRMTLSVGGELEGPGRSELQEHLSAEQEKTLLTLRELLQARWEARLQKGAMDNSSTQRSQPFVSGGADRMKPYSVDSNQSVHYTGDPVIRLSGHIVDPLEVTESTKQDLVSHAMLLGGEIAAQWCKERNIPLVFSGATLRPEDTVLSGILGSGGVSSTTRRSKGYSSPEPVPHIALGMDQYTKCTSPLRRYSDLLGHWQIEAALRHEAQSKQQNATESDRSIFPFPIEKIKSFISRSNWQNHLKDRAQSMSRDFWAMQLLFRGFKYQQAALPETFKCLIVTPLMQGSVSKIRDSKTQYMGSLLPFRLRCCISVDKDMPVLQAGDVVDVKIQQANLYNVFLDVDFVKLVKRVPEGGESASQGFFI